MIWLKHIILMLAVAVMTAGSALACCMTSHSDMTVMSEASQDAAPSHHKMEGSDKKGHLCDDPSNASNSNHSSNAEHDMCEGCVDCSFVMTQAKAHFSVSQIKIEYETEQVIHTLTMSSYVQPHVLTKFIKPPATAPPPLWRPIQLKQILIV